MSSSWRGAKLRDGRVLFPGNGGIAVLRGSKHAYSLDVTVWSKAIFFVDRDCYFNGGLHAVASEGRSIIIGRDCLFSFGIWVRAADPHIVYDSKTHRRINLSKDVVVGDHVWIGQDALVLKGSQIGSGSIIGAKSLVAGKKVHSNSSWGGNPAKEIRSDVFWDGASAHNWGLAQTKKSMQFDGDQYIFLPDESTLQCDEVLGSIHDEEDVGMRVEMLQKVLIEAGNNRFYLAKQPSPNTSAKQDGLLKRLFHN